MTNPERSKPMKRGDYSIVFKKLDELRQAEDVSQTAEDVRELDQIRKLRDIVTETTIQKKSYFSST